ncbi:hypothetical protein AB4556_08745, partial [Vibrio splendidus]
YMKEQSEIRNSKIKYKMKLVEKEDEISSLNETILFKDELIKKIRNAKTKIIIKGEFENEY